jgi:malate permease and related proteins
MEHFLVILKNIILPIFMLVGLGALVEKKFKLDIATISKLNFYVFVPALLFTALVESKLPFGQLAYVAGFQLVLILVLLGINAGVAKSMSLNGGLSAAFLMATVFCNSGNFGLPLVQLAFPEDPNTAAGYQAITIMVQNLSTFTIGLLIIGHGRAPMSDSLKETMKLPFVYVIAAALLVKNFQIPVQDSKWLWNPIKYASDGLIAVALITLGVQIAKTPKVKRIGMLTIANFMRLAVAPIAAFALVKLLILIGVPGFDGLLGKLVVVASSGPSAVNTVLISLEFKNEPDFAASAVFYSTLFSAITVALTIFLVQGFM